MRSGTVVLYASKTRRRTQPTEIDGGRAEKDAAPINAVDRGDVNSTKTRNGGTIMATVTSGVVVLSVVFEAAGGGVLGPTMTSREAT